MNFKVGDLVTRDSHNHDMIFVITRIEEDVCYLKGVNIRLCADSPLDDLTMFNREEEDDIENEEPFLKRIKPELLDRNDYFYLPGKILHIDADTLLCK